MPFSDESLLTMMTLHHFSLALMGLSLLSGCAAPTVKEEQARGNIIIIARYDSRSPEMRGSNGRAITDNAGGVPSAVAGAAGMPTSPAGGAALNIGVALVANLIFGEMAKDEIKMFFKVLYENKCEYGVRYLDLRRAPDAEKLYPGYMARIGSREDGSAMLQTLTDGNGMQVYLSKSHPCYATWVREWKEHQRVLASPTSWDTRRFAPILFGGIPLERISEPDMAWVK